MSSDPTIRALTNDDRRDAVAIINEAAAWYREFLPPDELHQPEMTSEEWEAEGRRMTWYGAFLADELVGVMGLEYSGDVALLRHAYVVPALQRRGIASALNDHLTREVRGVERIVVGTYAANYKARASLEKSGFRQSADSDAVLREYYDIPPDRLESSVAYEKPAQR